MDSILSQLESGEYLQLFVGGGVITGYLIAQSDTIMTLLTHVDQTAYVLKSAVQAVIQDRVKVGK